MNVISCLRLLRLIPASMPGKSRLTRWLIDRLAQNGEAEIPALGLSFFVPALREPIASSLLANGTYATLPLEDWMRGDRRPRPPQTSGGGDLVAFKPAA